MPKDTIWLNLVLSSLNSATYFVVYKLYCIVSLVKLSYKPLQGLRGRGAEPHRKKGFFIIVLGMPIAATSIAIP